MMRSAGLALTLTIVGVISGPAWSQSLPLPFNLGGDFVLTDQTGATRGQVDPDGKHQLLFFGYANCQEICSAVFPLMAEITDTLQAGGQNVRPVMITVDPKRDTVEKIGPALRTHHADFVGLTGTDTELQVAYDAFSVDREEVFFDPEFGPVFSHGSFIYLLDEKGKFLTLIPPILGPDEASALIGKYLKKADS